ncbi:MAG: DUF4395 domain-containing protein [Gammaproteobacteria bacterium]|nr:DUF4395 domain-containing protein [Gammaproteobacteria bacterium]
MGKIVQFGEEVAGYNIPVLNEREIRAAAGILFFIMYTSVLNVIFRADFLLLKYAVTAFLVDFIVRVSINPKYSPTLIIGRMIVRNQVPEYVGAQQKKFAWVIGVVLATIFFTFSVVINSYSPITGIICLICLLFLFFEAVFGICLGCMFYNLFYKEKAQHCPGEVCAAGEKQDIQKISMAQMLVVLAFIAFIVLTVVIFNDYFSQETYDLLGVNPAEQL